MEAKELMIGDWVNIIPEEYRDENYNIQIDRIQPKMSNRLRVGAGKYYSHINLITPIPLTEEILEMNEFYEPKEEYDKWGEMFCVDIDAFQYVHELQHALRLCGLNELADNFKVNE